MPKKDERHVEKVATKLERSAPVTWDEQIETLDATDRREVAAELVWRAIRAARLAAYVDARRDGATHARAVDKQNKVAATLRKAFGFTYSPAADFRF